MTLKLMFRIIFKTVVENDNDFILVTTTAYMDDEIKRIIEMSMRVNSYNCDGYTPLSIMQDVCKDNPGWRFTKTEMQPIEVDIL